MPPSVTPECALPRTDVSPCRHADTVLPVAAELQQRAHTSADPVAQELCGGEEAVRAALEAYLRWAASDALPGSEWLGVIQSDRGFTVRYRDGFQMGAADRVHVRILKWVTFHSPTLQVKGFTTSLSHSW